MSSNTKVFLITGCSSGLGSSLAQHFLAAGHQVAVTARDIATVSDFTKKYPATALALPLDVTDRTSIADAVTKTVKKFGRIDVLINNAGFAIDTAAENYTEEEIRSVMETNFFGAVFMTQAVLPVMRKQHSGTILQVSSALGVCGLCSATVYCASKFALEGFSEALAQEVASHNIRVIVVEPGTFKTQFKSKLTLPSNPSVDDYPAVKQAFVYRSLMEGAELGDPVRFATTVEKLLELERPPVRIPLGSDSVSMIQAHLKSQLADLEKFRHLSESTNFDPLPEASIRFMNMLKEQNEKASL